MYSMKLAILMPLLVLMISCHKHDENGKLSKQEIVTIAETEFRKDRGTDADLFYPRYDKENRRWNSHCAADYPDLLGRDYQAIEFRPRKLQGGVEAIWLCIDKETGEVLKWRFGT